MDAVLERQICDALARKWLGATKKAKAFVPNVPLHVFVGEAFELAYFIEHYWEPRPEFDFVGLKHAANSTLLPETAAQEIRELALAVIHLQAQHNAMVVARCPAPVERANFVLRELRLVLRFVFDDKVKTQEDAALANLEKHIDRSSHDALALTLYTFAHFADTHRRRLEKVPTFDLSLIEEGMTLTQRLREQSSNFLRDGTLQRKDVHNARTRLCRLLHDRMTDARAAIRFTLRDHPDIVQRATSQYRRERRAGQRARKGKARTTKQAS